MGRRRKLVSFAEDLLGAAEQYGRDNDQTLDEILDNALRDFLKSEGQPLNLRDALKQSAKLIPANDRQARTPKTKKRKS